MRSASPTRLSINGWRLTNASRSRSFWISTTPAMSCTATSNCRCSTPIMTSAAFCRSMSMTPKRSRPVALVLRPGKTPSGVEVRAHLRRLVRRIRKSLERRRASSFRGDGHYARPEAMAWCEENGVDYIFGLPGTKPSPSKVEEVADAIRIERAVRTRRPCAATPRRHTSQIVEPQRRVSPASRRRAGARYPLRRHQHRPQSGRMDLRQLYCARGQAENLIKLHKAQLASDRTSCRAAIANQMRLVLHTAAYWLVLAVRDAIPKMPSPRPSSRQCACVL